MKNQSIDSSKVHGWGVDADPKNNPTYPMRDISKDSMEGADWHRPAQQRDSVEVLQSIEFARRPAVFGTSTPPSGLSGVIRRAAFRYSEAEWAHWLMLMFADRVNVVEGLVDDVRRNEMPNIPREMGVRSELAFNRAGLAKKVAVSGVVIIAGVAIVRRISHRRRQRQY